MFIKYSLSLQIVRVPFDRLKYNIDMTWMRLDSYTFIRLVTEPFQQIVQFFFINASFQQVNLF